MARKHYKTEEIIHKLREAEVLIGQGYTTKEAAKELGGHEQTYYRWRKEYSGMDKCQARRMKDLERENAQLKKLVERIWRQEGLKVPTKQPKRGRLWPNDGSCIRLRPLYQIVH